MIRENNVIDNKKVVLKDELLKILPKTEHASIAVGYFFISGLSVIIQPLKDVDRVRLLISNTTDKTTAEALIEGFRSIKEVRSKVDETNFVNKDRKTKVVSDSKDNTKKSLEHMTQTTEDKIVVESLIDMMKARKLEVRVYPKEKLHAKAYIFTPKDTDFAQGMGIVGSSNLSIAGITHNSELNLKTYNPPDVNKLLAWFDELWKDGLEFTEDFKLILENSWAGKIYSPRDLFLKATYLEYKDKLEEQYKIDPVWKETFPKLFRFQENAVDLGLAMFELYGGMIIGDVVGLGKTYIGIALLKYLQREYRPLIICPPPLIPMWEKICEDYEVDAKILSRGKLSQQSFELYQNYRYKSRDLVLIDESHHFRNNDSRQYENLHQFMQAQDARAILLTATPYSNRAADIKNQIMLFHQTPKTSIPPANETDLDKYFRQVDKGEADLVDLLRNIMIRRTRRYVLNQWGKKDESGRRYLRVGNEDKYFPKREMRTIRYDINKVYQRQYQTIVDHLATPDSEKKEKRLTLARYSLGLYVKDEYRDVPIYKDLSSAGTKLIGLIRSLLLKRMESSIDAFQKSIKHYVHTHKIFLALLDERIVPIGDVSYKEMYDIAKSDPDSINDPETIEEFRKKIRESGETKYEFDAFDIESLTRDVQNDIEIFKSISGLISDLTYRTDDKLHRLQDLLSNEYAGKKVLIFSEFAATAQYLDKHLKWKGVKEQVDSTIGDPISCARRFDPDNNPSNEQRPTRSEEITLMIATDVLAEGVNLQAGQVIINYDFHWNPTRLIQRAGRVDRIGSKNESVTIHNFLLAPEMRESFTLEDDVDAKIDNIQRIIGEDYKILKEDEQINPQDLYAIYNGDESVLDREEGNPLEPSKFEKILQNIQVNKPEFWNEIREMPDGIRSVDEVKSGGKLLLACESGARESGKVRKYYLINDKEEIKEMRMQEALELLESDDTDSHSVPQNYDRLVSVCWKKFVDDIEQVQAKTASVRLNTTQKWIIERLIKMGGSEEFSDKRDMIETLRKAFYMPILKGKLRKELLKIKKSSMGDSDMLQNLSQLYLHYNLQHEMRQYEEETYAPRILYSKYVGK